MRNLNLDKVISKEIPVNYYSETKLLLPHQSDAVKDVQKSIGVGKKKILLSMPPGSGKTIISLVLAKLFMLESDAKILFLNYFRVLQEQLEHELSIPYYNQYSVAGKDENWQNKRIVLATYHQVLHRPLIRKTDFDIIICLDSEKFSIEKTMRDHNGYVIGFTDGSQRVDTNPKNQLIADVAFSYSIKDITLAWDFIRPDNSFSFFEEIHSKLGIINETLSIKSTDVSDIKGILDSLNSINDVLKNHQELFSEFIKKNIKVSDITTLAYKKAQLNFFSKLLYDEVFFNEQKVVHSNSSERVWQNYFENNTWIFGYGLNFFFGSPLENKKFEQVISGHTFSSSGKRIDALMKTMGSINSMCFVEIKTHVTPLLENEPYRNEAWAISRELSGAIAQIQNYKYNAIKNISSKIEIKTKEGIPTGEIIYNYNPKAILLIGNLAQFTSLYGVNESQLASFELFRRNIEGIEIITFDELYERAKFILEDVSFDGN
ncbi:MULTISPECIES: Shedu anti-phage system protein SduA domain-containing protein [Paenibacillus]|uniref:Shedu anti-phage system protein SduA domain-containing protein n=1 Tax=Paenibacillus TaxID=44249 RepID=UPI003009E357